MIKILIILSLIFTIKSFSQEEPKYQALNFCKNHSLTLIFDEEIETSELRNPENYHHSQPNSKTLILTPNESKNSKTSSTLDVMLKNGDILTIDETKCDKNVTFDQRKNKLKKISIKSKTK